MDYLRVFSTIDIINLKNYYFNPHAIPLLIVSFLIFLSGLLIILKTKNIKTGISFFLMSISCSLWFLGTMFGYLTNNAEIAKFWFKIDNLGVMFLSTNVYAFVTSFLNIFQKRKNLVFIGYVISTILAFLTLSTNLMVRDVQLFYWGFFPQWGKQTFIFFPFFFSYMLLSFIELIAFYRKSKNNVIKKQITYFLTAFFIAYTSSIDFFATFGIAIYPLSFIPMSIYFLVISYAITKQDLMDIKVVISRTASYGIVATLIILSFLFVNLANLHPILLFLANTSLCLFWIYFAEKLRLFIQTPLEEKWVTSWYDHNKLLNDITQNLIPVYEKKMLFKVIANQLKNTIKIKNVQIITDLKDSDNFPSTVSKFNNGIIIPLSSSKKIEGVIILGPKISEDPYDNKDIELFNIIKNQAVLVLDRILPYEQIKLDYDKAMEITEKISQQASYAILTRGIAHEIRNPMSILLTRAELTEKHIDDKEYVKVLIDMTKKNVLRLINITEAMLKYGKTITEQKENISLSSLIDDIMLLAEGEFKKREIKTEVNIDKNLTVFGDKNRLHQTFLNIIINSMQAINKGGTITISAKPEKYIDKNKVVRDGVEITFTDTGCGIPQENLLKIFDPFFTTKHECTGLGLALVGRIVDEHNGLIIVDSEVGKGTTVKIYLPNK